MREETKYDSRFRYTQKELVSYHQWLAELDQEAREPGGDLQKCDDDIWAIFDPAHWSGQQIYESFTNEELLDIVIRTMNQQGHAPHFEDIHYIYLQYLTNRFGGQNKIKELAKTRVRDLRNEQQWPLDWPERVSVERVLECRWRNPVSAEDIALLEDLCQRARESKATPALTPREKSRLNKFGGAGRVMKMMGIPVLRGAELQHMEKYWREERKNARQKPPQKRRIKNEADE